MTAGAAAISWSTSEKRKEQEQADFYKARYASELDDYFEQYEKWLQRPAGERSRLPWGLDEYGRGEIEVQSRQKQQGRLRADLDKLASGSIEVYPFADVFYGENWQEELRKYKERKEQREFIFTCSIVCISAGSAIFGCCLLIWTARLVIKVLSFSKKLAVGFFRGWKENRGKRPVRVDAREGETSLEHRRGMRKKRAKPKRHTEVLVTSGWHNFEEKTSEPCCENLSEKSEGEAEADGAASGARKIAVQLSNESSVAVGSKEPLQADSEGLSLNTMKLNSPAQNVQQSTLEHSGLLGNSIRELTQQMSAIREYASQQQDRVEKLQDGYDWGIIRTFCLRVIRGIDNLEERINRLSEQGAETADLREVRDELLFALESSGVEQFEPEIGSDYRGQEKCAEAVKERQCCDDPNMTDKIAKVIKPGYQYVFDQEHSKVVRTAQVMLYN